MLTKLKLFTNAKFNTVSPMSYISQNSFLHGLSYTFFYLFFHAYLYLEGFIGE